MIDKDDDLDLDLDLDYEGHPRRRKFRFGVRHIQVFLIFICLTVGMAMRINLSVTIVAMTDENGTSPNPNIPTFKWKNNSVILSSFFWGYIVLQIVAGYVSKLYGPKLILTLTFLVNSIAFLLIPLAAQMTGSIGVMVLRVIQGISQGCFFPCAHTFLGKWAPAEERSTLGIIVYSGLSCGSILSLIVSGYLCSTWIGWPSSFYVFGALGLIWCALYTKCGYNCPATHPSISPEERRYIEVSLGQSNVTEEIKIPWKSILTSIHFYAIVSANIGGSWGYTMLMTQVPTYLAKVMKFDIQSNGLVSAAPYMVGSVAGLIYAPFADFIISRGILPRLSIRRIFQFIGSYGLVLCLLLLSYVAHSQLEAVIFLCIGNAAYSATLVGYSVNHMDLSPRFAGIMQGISNCISQTIAMFSPLIVQFIVLSAEDASQWRIIFIIACVVYSVCAIFFVVFSSATRQAWDGPGSDESVEVVAARRQTIITIHSMPGFE